MSLVCQELGFDMVEFNASDTRSKKLLQDEIGKLLENTSLTPYFSREGNIKYFIIKLKENQFFFKFKLSLVLRT